MTAEKILGSFPPRARARGDANVTAGSLNVPRDVEPRLMKKTRAEARFFGIAPLARETRLPFPARTKDSLRPTRRHRRARRGESRFPPHSFSTRRGRHRQEYRGSFEYDVKRAEPKDKNENASKRKNAKSATIFFFRDYERSATARSSVFLIPSCGP